jgi:hypothetical protein
MRLVETRAAADLDTPRCTFDTANDRWEAHFPSFKRNGHDEWIGVGATKEAAAKVLQDMVDDLGGPMVWQDL